MSSAFKIDRQKKNNIRILSLSNSNNDEFFRLIARKDKKSKK